LNQLDSFFEIIVIDDGSTSPCPYVEQYRSLGVIYRIQSNSGQCVALNNAVNLSSGDLICFMDSDDLYPECYLSSVRNFFEKTPSADVLYTTPLPFKIPPSKISTHYKKILELSPSGFVLDHALICATKPYAWIGSPTSGIVIRRKAVNKLFPLWIPIGWKVAADQILCQKIILLGLLSFRTNKFGFFYRVHDGNSYLDSERRKHYLTTRLKVLGVAVKNTDQNFCRLIMSIFSLRFWHRPGSALSLITIFWCIIKLVGVVSFKRGR